MSKISKTAKASMPSGPVKEKAVIPDVELVRLLRIDRSSGIYPATQGTDALLREYDAALALLEGSKLAVKQLADLNTDLRAEIDSILAQRILLAPGALSSIPESRAHVAVEELETIPPATVPESGASNGNAQS